MTPLHKLFASQVKCLESPDRRPVWEWASEHVELPACLTIHGKFNAERSRHFKAPLEALQDDRIAEVNVLAPVRGGKTLLADTWTSWVHREDPGPMLAVMQSDDMAKKHCETRIAPMLDSLFAGAELRSVFKATGVEYYLPSGQPFFINGPGINKMQSVGYRYIRLDEPHLYAPGTIAEAKGRLGDYIKLGISKLFCIGQAGVEDDDWDRQHKTGEQNRWHVECAGCHAHFYPAWSGTRDGKRCGMVWDEIKNVDGQWNAEACARTARYECPYCGHPHFDTAKTKNEWNRTGRYELTGERNGTRKSFQWNAVIDSPWYGLVINFLEAMNAYKKGVCEPIVIFFQKYMAEAKSETGMANQQLNFVRQDYGGDWKELAFMCLSIDVQEQWFWVTARGWARSGESRRIGFWKMFSFADIEAKRVELKINPPQVLIDCGHKAKGADGVYQACCRYGWTAVKGDASGDGDALSFWHSIRDKRVQRSYAPVAKGDPESGLSGQGLRFCNVIRFSAPTHADRVMRMIERGLWKEPHGGEPEMELEYSKQMRDPYKKRKVNSFTGQIKLIWVDRGNDHAFDCAKMQSLFATIAGILPDEISELKAENASQPKAEASASSSS